MTGVRVNSKYHLNVLKLSVAVLGGLCFLLLLITMIILCNVNRFSSRRGATAIAWLVFATQVIMTIFLGTVSGFDQLHPAVAFLIAAILWIPTISTYILMTSSAWRTGFLISKAILKGDDDDDGPPNGGGGGGNSGDLTGVTNKRRMPCVGLISFIKAATRASIKRAKVFMIVTVFALIYTLVVILALGSICYCSNPTEVTTWASRRARASYCQTDKFCHLYSLIGVNSSRLRVVGHLVTETPPKSTWAELCEVASAVSGEECVSPVQTIAGKLLDHAHITEDRRYLSHVFLKNLNGSTLYKISVFIALGSEDKNISKSIVVRSLPDPESEETIEFIGGGDFHVGEKGMKTVKSAVLRGGEPRFFYLGGDLSYANNVRYCYLRWDSFLHFFASLRTRSGVAISLMTIPGNHESGGYMPESDTSKYFFYHQYLPQYDDDEPSDLMVTHHSHVIGKRLGLIGLDSGLYETVKSQTDYLEAKLKEFRQPTPSSKLADTRFTIVLYHNPAYPSSRPDSEDSSPDIRRLFPPLFDKYLVPLVFEYHDHTFKRTHPLHNNEIRENDGVVYIGDGALGVKPRTIKSGGVFVKTSAINYAQFVTVFPNGTCVVESYDVDGALHDLVTLNRRF